MLMHTKGILVMMPESAMVLTGQDGARLLGLGVGRGQPGHRRLRAHHGPERAGAVLRARPRRGVPHPVAPLRPHLRHGGRTLPAAGGHRGPGRSRRAHLPARARRRRGVRDSSATSSRDVTNPGRKKPFDIRRIMLAVSDQDHTPLERWAGWRDAEVGVVWDAHVGGYPVCMLGFESRSTRPPRVRADRRPGALDIGHAVPDGVEEGGARGQRRQRQPATAGAREPLRVRRLTGVDAATPAGVRRGDRACGHQLQRADRVRRDLPLPRRRVRGLLAHAERQHAGRRARRHLRIGHRGRPGGGSGLRARRRSAHAQGPARAGAREGAGGRRRGGQAADSGRGSPR